MTDILKDVSVLSTIPEETLRRLNEKESYCICSAVEESLLSGEQITEVDIGIGTLCIQHVGDSLQYRFVPSKGLEEEVKETYLSGKCCLSDKLDTALVKRITDAYKDII